MPALRAYEVSAGPVQGGTARRAIADCFLPEMVPRSAPRGQRSAGESSSWCERVAAFALPTPSLGRDSRKC